MASSTTSTSSTTPALYAVDIRLFLLTTIVSMMGAFLAGFAFVPPQAWIDSVSSLLPSSSLALPQSTLEAAAPVGRSTLEDLIKADAVFTSLEHSPSGQHLLVDIQGIETAFLDSEERLASAMVQTVQEAGLTMLSYHCHKLDPAGISCVGVLLESHISFHTWPEEGVITLDLFTCGANPLLPVVPVIERLFGIPKSSNEKLNVKWAHELRGFRSAEEKRKNYLDNFSDLSVWILSPLEIHSKKMIYSNLTKYQRVDIWDLVEPENQPSYNDGIKHNLPDGDPRWLDTDYFTPDRILFLDGIIQSLMSHEAEYHESLVHPAMFAHPGPAHVAIIGGGEGATLREVLKHKTVQHVTMIEIDEELIQITREFLPEMSNCSHLEGRADNCFDDEIVQVVNENGLQWFNDRYSTEMARRTVEPERKYDVIIVDALDPEDDVPFTEDLYVDPVFISSIMNSLTEEGVIMIQIGTAPELDDPRPDLGTYQVREKLFRLFEGHDQVAAMHVYEEARSGYLEPHSFMIVCKNVSCRSRWYARSDAIDYEIYNRIVKTKSGKGALKFFDGTTHRGYQFPPISFQTVYCRREPTPFECAYRHMDMTKDVYEFHLDDSSGESSFVAEINKNESGEIIGSSVKAKVDIPKGSYIMPDQLTKSLIIPEASVESIKRNAEGGAPLFDELARFVEWNGHKSHMDGDSLLFLEMGASILMREVDNEEEANVGRWVPANGKRPTYSPVYDRHRVSFEVFMVATQDIPAGSELKRQKGMWSA